MNRKLNSKLIIKPDAELNKNIFLLNVIRQFKEGNKVWI